MLPKAGDIVVMSECLSHAVLPWRADKPRLCLQLRYKCGRTYDSHFGNYPEPWPAEVLARCSQATQAIVAGDADVLSQLPTVPVTASRAVPCTHPLSAGAVLVPPAPLPITASSKDSSRMVSNDAVYSGGVRDLLASGTVPPPESPHHGLSGSDADGPAICEASGTVASEYSGLSHAERYLFDCHGIVVLRGCLSPSELSAARAAAQRARQSSQPYNGILEEPALQSLITHPRLLPVLLELMEGKPHLTSIGANHKDANRALNGLRPGGAAQVCRPVPILVG